MDLYLELGYEDIELSARERIGDELVKARLEAKATARVLACAGGPPPVSRSIPMRAT